MLQNKRLVPPIMLCILVLLLGSCYAFSCTCAPQVLPCEAVGDSQLVFLGTVIEVHSASEFYFKTAKMRVDRAYKGTLEDTVELFDDGMCDGPNLEVGHQYLMYTSRTPTGAIPVRGCTRSRRVEDAAEDMQYLSRYSAGIFIACPPNTSPFIMLDYYPIEEVK